MMLEPLNTLRIIIVRVSEALFRHRMIYAGLAFCHGLASLLTKHPEIYVPMAALYTVLAFRE